MNVCKLCEPRTFMYCYERSQIIDENVTSSISEVHALSFCVFFLRLFKAACVSILLYGCET